MPSSVVGRWSLALSCQLLLLGSAHQVTHILLDLRLILCECWKSWSGSRKMSATGSGPRYCECNLWDPGGMILSEHRTVSLAWPTTTA